MKTLIRILLVQLCCLPLCITDAMARDGGRTNERKDERPKVRPTKPQSRNPITQSKVPSKPASRPATKPATRPSGRPSGNPAERPVTRPQSKPASRPNPPDRPQTKPAARPNPPVRPQTKPAGRPDLADRPQTKPSGRPDISGRPQTKPGVRPELPGRPNRPETKPDRPGRPSKPGVSNQRPELPNRPNKPKPRPQTKPGQIAYPKPSKPVTLPGTANRPGTNRPGLNRPNQKPEVKPGKNTRPIRKPQLNQVNINQNKNNWWVSNKNSNNRTRIVNNKVVYRGDTNIRINRNFQNKVNWSTNRKYWGYNPWWNRPATRPWYGGSWNCGWNRRYYRHHHHYSSHHYHPWGYRPPGYVIYDDDDDDIARAIGWGLVGWGLGKLIFDSGYQTYTNPYPAQPVATSTGSPVTYSQPITVVAAQTAPPEADAEKITELSESHIADSQEAFKRRDYLKALEGANRAVAEAPGDGALHEYRALVLFALGKYSEAAGVLNPVLAGGPGWDWTTMIGLYDSQATYMSQLEALGNYCDSKPDAADARFLLGYHYMVCGHLAEAAEEFAAAARLQPADSVSAQLRDLTRASSNNGEEDEEPAADEAPAPPPAPVPLENLTGTWVADSGAQGTVTLAFKDDGKFVWNFTKDGQSNGFGGDFSMNDDGLLVLDAEESQMVAAVEMPEAGRLKFVLTGGPPGDPGLAFAKK